MEAVHPVCMASFGFLLGEAQGSLPSGECLYTPFVILHGSYLEGRQLITVNEFKKLLRLICTREMAKC